MSLRKTVLSYVCCLQRRAYVCCIHHRKQTVSLDPMRIAFQYRMLAKRVHDNVHMMLFATPKQILDPVLSFHPAALQDKIFTIAPRGSQSPIPVLFLPRKGRRSVRLLNTRPVQQSSSSSESRNSSFPPRPRFPFPRVSFLVAHDKTRDRLCSQTLRSCQAPRKTPRDERRGEGEWEKCTRQQRMTVLEMRLTCEREDEVQNPSQGRSVGGLQR